MTNTSAHQPADRNCDLPTDRAVASDHPMARSNATRTDSPHLPASDRDASHVQPPPSSVIEPISSTLTLPRLPHAPAVVMREFERQFGSPSSPGQVVRERQTEITIFENDEVLRSSQPPDGLERRPEPGTSSPATVVEYPRDTDVVAGDDDSVAPTPRNQRDDTHLPDPTLAKKLVTAREQLVPVVLQQLGLSQSQLSFSDAALRAIVERHANKAGVHDVHKSIELIATKVTRWLGESATPPTIRVEAADVIRLLNVAPARSPLSI